jgi:hypothetical protein
VLGGFRGVALIAVVMAGLAIVAGIGCDTARAQEPTAGAQQGSGAQAGTQSSGTQAGAATATTIAAAKPAAKAHKVITNDDIQSSASSSFGGVFYVNTGSINDCDANCFEQVRVMSGASFDKDPNWRRKLLDQIDYLRSDSEWQAYLHGLYSLHDKICQAGFDKQDELRRSGNYRNVGPQDIAINDEYDAKIEPMKAQLDSAEQRQTAEQKRFSDKPYAAAFAGIQGTRMKGGFCSQARVIYPTVVYPTVVYR